MKIRHRHNARWATYLTILSLVVAGFVVYELGVGNRATVQALANHKDPSLIWAGIGVYIASAAIILVWVQTFLAALQIQTAEDMQHDTQLLRAVQELTAELRKQKPVISNSYTTSLFSLPAPADRKT